MKGLAFTACPSKILDRRWKESQYNIHKRKLRNIKSTIRAQSQSNPSGGNVYTNLRNGKKEAIMECKLKFNAI